MVGQWNENHSLSTGKVMNGLSCFSSSNPYNPRDQ
jgi:hypothetical protein